MKLKYACQNAQMIINKYSSNTCSGQKYMIFYTRPITKNVTFFKVTNEHQDETFDEIMLVLIQGV